MNRLITGLLLLNFFQMAEGQTLKEVAYNDGDQKLNGLVTDNAGKKLPGVLILSAWMGIDDEAKNAALNLAKNGYIAFIADIYGEGNIPKTMPDAAKIATTFKSDYQLYQQRIALALEELKKSGADESKLAVIGYCFGGTGALEAARANLPVQGVVSIHGGLSKGNRPNGPLQTKILVLHGADDSNTSEKDLQDFRTELDSAGADWQMIYYAGCKHTFTNPASPDYNEIMANRSWKHTLLFLNELFE